MQDSRVDVIERKFILRIARALPLALSAFAVLGLVVSVALGVYALLPVREPEFPADPVSVAAVTVSEADIREALAPSPRASASPASASPVAQQSTPRAASPDAIALATEIHGVRTLVTAGGASWSSINERYCSDPFRGVCYRWTVRTVTEGVGPLLLDVLELYGTDDTSERASAPGSDDVYLVNVTNASAKLAALRELREILAAFPATERRRAFVTWTRLRQTREAARQAQIDSENAARQERYASAVAEAAAAQESRATAKVTAKTGIVSALTALFAIGMVLAVLAIERNTRALRDLAAVRTPDASEGSA